MDHAGSHWNVNYRKITVRLKDGTIVTGKLNTVDYPKVSDFLNNLPHNFFVLIDTEHDGSPDKSVMIINKEEVAWTEMKTPVVKKPQPPGSWYESSPLLKENR